MVMALISGKIYNKFNVQKTMCVFSIALVAGYALVALFSLMGNLSYLSILHLILFQGIFALIGTLIPNLKKY